MSKGGSGLVASEKIALMCFSNRDADSWIVVSKGLLKKTDTTPQNCLGYLAIMAL